MQTPKARSNSSGAPQRISRSSSLEVSGKNSPQPATSDVSQKNPRVVRQLKTSPRYSEPTASSSNLATRAPRERSPKVVDNRSPKSPLSEKKRPSRVAELESQISQLQNDLKDAKDQICSSETSKEQALKDAEQANQRLSALSTKLEEARKQLLDQSASNKEVHIAEESEERDQVCEWSGSDAVASALDEIKQLKVQLEVVTESEATQTKQSESAQSELHKLKQKLVETLSLVEDMKNQINSKKESEAEAQGLVIETLMQLETAKKMVEVLRSEGCKATEAYDAIASELEQSRAHVSFLEQLVNKIKADIRIDEEKRSMEGGKELDLITSLNLEIEQLQSTLVAAEIRYNEEQVRSAEQLRNAIEMVERMKSASDEKEGELEAVLHKSKNEIEELKANLMDKETELQGICEENEALTLKLENSLSGQRESELENELRKLKAEMENLKACLMEKETEWNSVLEENEKLKSKIKEVAMSDEIVSDVEKARASEREVLMKVGYMKEEVDKSNRKTERVLEQLEAAQAANAEMEAELRRLKVQSDQWRKAAEAAAAMLSAGNNNGQLMERTGSMDSNYSPRIGRMSSPFGDDLDDQDSLKKKNANMLKRLGVLWKKPQK